MSECEKCTKYERPTGRLYDILNAGLGPLPAQTKFPKPVLHPHEKGKWSRRIWALATLALVVSVAVGLYYLSPIFALSPFSVIESGAIWLLGDTWWASGLIFMIGGALLAYVVTRSPELKIPYRDKILDIAAVREELWFRTGAESWSWWQRLYSCLAFGVVHIVNIIYPLASIGAIAVAGGVFMYVYLREYRRTRSRSMATLAATRFHATYNRYAFTLLVAVLGYVLFF